MKACTHFVDPERFACGASRRTACGVWREASHVLTTSSRVTCPECTRLLHPQFGEWLAGHHPWPTLGQEQDALELLDA